MNVVLDVLFRLTRLAMGDDERGDVGACRGDVDGELEGDGEFD